MENNTQLQRLTFDQAKRAKAVGFDWAVKWHYLSNDKPIESQYWLDFNAASDILSAPENALFLQWAREVKGVHGMIDISTDNANWGYAIQNVKDLDIKPTWSYQFYHGESHAKAETALVDEILNVLER
jgi:hypothetical protein